VVERREDEADRRRTIVSIAEDSRADVDAWLANGARAWRAALEPLTDEQREMFVATLRAYEKAVGR
jgi:DNA-binding MarR family transcriptional regulator